MTSDEPTDGGALPHLVLAAGSTATARVDGISAAGAAPSLLAHTPAADAEVVALGDVAAAPAVPASPSGCPSPALFTRAAREVLGFDATVVDAGLAAPTAAPTVDVGAAPGRDLREAVAVPDAAAIVERASEWAREWTSARSLDRIAVAETIPGGTTTALGLLRALGEREAVSSSLPENPVERKRALVAAGLDASDLGPGDCAGRPVDAIRAVGDPVQATILGIVEGALAAGAAVALWGGTQLLAVVAALRHRGGKGGREGASDLRDASPTAVDDIRVATTSYVADDESAAVRDLAAALDVDLAVVDPSGEGPAADVEDEHVALRRFAAGEAKEGVGMGGALALAERRGQLPAVRARFADLYDAMLRERSDGGAERGP